METQNSSLHMILGTALATVCSLAGGLAIALVTGNLLFESFNVHASGLVSGLLALPVFLIGLFGGGGLWGYWIARMTGAGSKQMVKVGAITYGGTVILVGILLELVFGLLGSLQSLVTLPIHIAFTIVFVPAAGGIAALCSYGIAVKLGEVVRVKARVGQIGLAAAGGFLVVNLIMLALGWQVGGPGAAERFTMITVMLTSNGGAALAGGAVLGWALNR